MNATSINVTLRLAALGALLALTGCVAGYALVLKTYVGDLTLADVSLDRPARQRYVKPSPAHLRISLATNRDLQAILSYQDLHSIHATVSLCQTKTEIAVTPLFPAGTAGPPYIYAFLLAPRSVTLPSVYDLVSSPQDICIVVEAVPDADAGAGVGLHSNQIVVPGGQIGALLRAS
jgi:hypothetical protein